MWNRSWVSWLALPRSSLTAQLLWSFIATTEVKVDTASLLSENCLPPLLLNTELAWYCGANGSSLKLQGKTILRGETYSAVASLWWQIMLESQATSAALHTSHVLKSHTWVIPPFPHTPEEEIAPGSDDRSGPSKPQCGGRTAFHIAELTGAILGVST